MSNGTTRAPTLDNPIRYRLGSPVGERTLKLTLSMAWADYHDLLPLADAAGLPVSLYIRELVRLHLRAAGEGLNA